MCDERAKIVDERTIFVDESFGIWGRVRYLYNIEIKGKALQPLNIRLTPTCRPRIKRSWQAGKVCGTKYTNSVEVSQSVNAAQMDGYKPEKMQSSTPF